MNSMVPLTPSAWLGRVLLFSCLTLVVTVGGVVVVGRQWIGEALSPSSSERVGLADTGSGGQGRVLAATDENPGVATELIFRIKTRFLALMQVDQLEVTDSLTVAGETVLGGLQVGGDATLSEGLTVDGDAEFANGLEVTGGSIDADGIDVDLGAGTITASNVVYSLIAGNGISLAGTQTVTVTNADPGSAQKIFGKVKVGDVTLTPGSNTDTLTLSAGSGVSLGTDADTDTITVSAANQSGWYKPTSTVVALITNTNNVGLGLSVPTNKLEIDSGSTDTSGMTFTRLTSASSSGIGGGKVLSLDSGGRVILVNDQTGDTPTAESVLPDADTGSTLFFNGTNWVASTNLYHNGGTVGISTTSPAARFHSYTNAVGTIGAVIQGITDQTANLQEWRNGAGSILSYIDAAGVFNGSANVAGSIDPGLVEGQVAYQGADGLAGSNNLFWNNAAGNLGIGTTVPLAKLDVNGDVAVNSSGKIDFSDTVGDKLLLYSTTYKIGVTGNQMYFTTNTDFDFQGALGIHEDSADALLEVSANGGASDLLMLSADDAGDGDRFVVKNSGNVGIGTTTPGAKLHVSGGVQFDGQGIFNGAVYLNNSGSSYLSASANSTLNINNTAAASIAFLTSNTSRMTIDSAGNVGIGTTTPLGKLHVEGAATGKALAILNETGNQDILVASTSGSTKFKIGNTGNIETGSIVNIGGATGNAGTLYFFNNGVRIERTGNSGLSFVTSGSAVGGGSTFTTGGAATSPLTVRGAAAQTAPLQEWHNSASTVLTVINAAGNIGVGTTTPLTKLHVAAGNILIDHTQYLQGGLSASIGNSIEMYNGSTGDMNFTTYDANKSYVFKAASTALLTIKGGGNVGIGTTAPTAPLEVNGVVKIGGYITFNGDSGSRLRSDSTGLFSVLTGSGSAYGDMQFGNGTVGSPAIRFGNDADTGLFSADSSTELGVSVGGVERIRVDSSGNVGIGSTTPGSKLSIASLGSSTGTTLVIDANGDVWKDSSSLRYKDNVKLFSDDFSKILQLNPSSFRYTANNITTIGYVAEELDSLGLTELVVYDKEGKPDAIRYDKFSIYLLEVLKQQQTQINNLGQLESPSLPAPQPMSTATEWLGIKLQYLAEVIFTKPVAFLKDAAFGGHISLNQDTTGTVTIPQGATKVRVTFAEQFGTVPVVHLTPQQSIVGAYKQESVTESGFEITLVQAQSSDTHINWLAVMSQDAGGVKVEVLEQGAVSGASVDASPAPQFASPTPTHSPEITLTPTPSSSPSATPDVSIE